MGAHINEFYIIFWLLVNVRLNNIIILAETNQILFLRQFADSFETISNLFKIKALKMVCCLFIKK